ncbi:MAG: hypothetical protein HY519_03000 [Candidatus Aenigmarchaeota archaeon]|nr:hypothetical protein [Candidatus Aenigmarchaeota archaeon]
MADERTLELFETEPELTRLHGRTGPAPAVLANGHTAVGDMIAAYGKKLRTVGRWKDARQAVAEASGLQCMLERNRSGYVLYSGNAVGNNGSGKHAMTYFVGQIVAKDAVLLLGGDDMLINVDGRHVELYAEKINQAYAKPRVLLRRRPAGGNSHIIPQHGSLRYDLTGPELLPGNIKIALGSLNDTGALSIISPSHEIIYGLPYRAVYRRLGKITAMLDERKQF